MSDESEAPSQETASFFLFIKLPKIVHFGCCNEFLSNFSSALNRVPLGIRLRRDGAPLPILPAQNGKGVDPGSALSLSLNRGGEKDHATRVSVDTNPVTALDRDLAAHTLTPDPNQKGNEKVDPVRNG